MEKKETEFLKIKIKIEECRIFFYVNVVEDDIPTSEESPHQATRQLS